MVERERLAIESGSGSESHRPRSRDLAFVFAVKSRFESGEAEILWGVNGGEGGIQAEDGEVEEEEIDGECVG